MSKHRLLLADDSVTIQKVVNLTFADEGIEVITAGDGNTAMEKFVESTPDLVMVDVNMPGFDGYRICEMIKQDEETRHIPVILLVGSFEPFDEEEARRVGADDYLTKPFQSIRQLVSRVSDLLNRTNGGNLNYKPAIVGADNAEMSADSFVGFAETKIEPDFSGFDAAGMDDEMIQTNQIGSLPADETQKFISEPSVSTANDGFHDLMLPEKEDDLLKIDSLEIEDFKQTSMNSDEELFSFDEKSYQFADELPYLQTEQTVTENQIHKTLNKQHSPSSENALPNNSDVNMTTEPQNDLLLDFDEFNFLELPPVTKKPPAKIEEVLPVEEPFEITKAENVTEQKDFAAQAGNSVVTNNSEETKQLSPEIIEAIAKKIMEKLSDKVIREIVQEMTQEKQLTSNG